MKNSVGFIVFAITLYYVNSCPCQHAWWNNYKMPTAPPNMIWKLVPDKPTSCSTTCAPTCTTPCPVTTTTCAPPPNCGQNIIIQFPCDWAKQLKVEPTPEEPCKDTKPPSFVCSCGKHHHVHHT